MRIKEHFLSYTLIPLFVLFVGSSYVRFIVHNDYYVSFEGTCDPYTQECFLGCNDDECSDVYYYSNVQKYAPDVERQCGKDITECELANECTALENTRCTIELCTGGEEGGCEILTAIDKPMEEESQNEPYESTSETL